MNVSLTGLFTFFPAQHRVTAFTGFFSVLGKAKEKEKGKKKKRKKEKEKRKRKGAERQRREAQSSKMFQGVVRGRQHPILSVIQCGELAGDLYKSNSMPSTFHAKILTLEANALSYFCIRWNLGL